MDEAALAMQERVRFIGRDDWTDLEAGRRAIVTITTHAGAVLTEEVAHTPMTPGELVNKFNNLVLVRCGHEKSARIAGMLKNIAAAGSVRPLMAELAAD